MSFKDSVSPKDPWLDWAGDIFYYKKKLSFKEKAYL